MKEITNAPACEFANDLISFVYGELDPSETQAFEAHLNSCHICAAEVNSFGAMRTAIGDWKFESLAGLLPMEETAVTPAVRKKSAVAALREFFNLSPLWLKGAVGFAGVLLCVLVLFVAARWAQSPTIAKVDTAAKTYDEQQVKTMIADALAKQAAVSTATASTRNTATPQGIEQPRKVTRSDQSPSLARNRRPLSKAEREQLAADLRLSTSRDDVVVLLSDKINEE